MVGHELTVEQRELAYLEPRDEPGKGDFGSIGLSAEHRFAKKGAAQFDPIESADQFACPIAIDVPAFDRVCMTRSVEVACRLLDRAVDPRFATIGASTDDGVEGDVMRDGEISRAQAPQE